VTSTRQHPAYDRIVLNARNPAMTWSMTVSSLTATLGGTLALGSGHTIWEHVLFWVVLVTTIPVLGYFLLIGLVNTSRWMQRRLPALPWRRVYWSIPVGAVAIGVLILAISQLVGGSQPTPAPPGGGQSVTALVGPDNTYDATEGLLTAPGTVTFSADGRTVAVDDCTGNQAKGRAIGRVYLWSVATRKLETSLSVPPHGRPDCGNMPVSAFSRNGKLLAVGDTNGDITYLWHAGSDRLAASLDPQYGETVADVAFSPDSQTLAVEDSEGDTVLWSTATRRLIRDISAPSDQVSLSAVAFSPNGKLLAIAEYGGATELVSVSHGTTVAKITDPRNKQQPDSGNAEFATFSPDGKILATGDGDGRTYLWSVTNHHLIAALSDPGGDGSPGEAPNALFSPVNDTLATTDLNGNVYLWDIARRKIIATFTNPDSSGDIGLAFSPNGRMLAICGGRNTYLWNPS